MRAINPDEFLASPDATGVRLRLLTLDDVSPRYVEWLEDPEVNKYLETRFVTQTLESVESFVRALCDSPHSYLFAIIEGHSRHIGNVKLGPINSHHSFADVSYFLGERDTWGKGYATQAVRLITEFAFERLQLHRCQAGFYASHVGSQRVLEKAGYVYEGRLVQQLQLGDRWEDHVWYGALRDGWR